MNLTQSFDTVSVTDKFLLDYRFNQLNCVNETNQMKVEFLVNKNNKVICNCELLDSNICISL